MTDKEIQKFKYDTRELLPCDRKELIHEHIQKAIALIDCEIIIQESYRQMDYGSLNMWKYKEAREMLIKALDEAEY